MNQKEFVEKIYLDAPNASARERNLGDVMLEGDEIYGDGVNIVARPQALAEPGGILISRPVYEQVHNKLSIGSSASANKA